MIAALGGVDLLVFTGGIGENDVEARAAICGGLSWLGVGLDEARNRSANNPISDSGIALRGARSALAGRRADRSPYLGIVPMEFLPNSRGEIPLKIFDRTYRMGHDAIDEAPSALVVKPCQGSSSVPWDQPPRNERDGRWTFDLSAVPVETRSVWFRQSVPRL